MSNEKPVRGATIWLPSPVIRDRLNKKCRKNETVYEMLKRKGVFR